MQNNQNNDNKELMVFLAEKFDAIGKRFDTSDQKFDAIGKRFDTSDQKFDAIGKRFDTSDQKFDAIGKRFDINDQKFDAIGKRFDINDQKFDAIGKRFDINDQKFDGVDKKLNAFQNQNVSDYRDLADLMIGQFEKVYEKFNGINQALDQKPDKAEVAVMIKTEIDRVAGRIVRQNDKIDDGRAEQIGMRRQLDKHEKWLSKAAAKIGIEFQPE